MKKLFRSSKNKMWAGVFGGLGEYFNIDPSVFRLAWLFISLTTGLVPGLIFYFFATLIVPKKAS